MRTGTKPCEILLAEDNSADIVVVRQALEGHDVDCVLHVTRDGAEAIKWIESLDSDPVFHSLDLVLLDMHLPKRGGEEILKRLQSTRRYSRTPVILMTSLDSRIVEEQGIKHPSLSYFRKPSTLDEYMQLGLMVREILQKTNSPESADQSGPGGIA
ncbi:MAG TPA: response regulator [Bryobacteraceae bacterium]|nr:response regulator [Bryobacteraceae bacterium]